MALTERTIKGEDSKIATAADMGELCRAIDSVVEEFGSDSKLTEGAVDRWLATAATRAAELFEGRDPSADADAWYRRNVTHGGEVALARASGAMQTLATAVDVWGEGGDTPAEIREEVGKAVDQAHLSMTVSEEKSAVGNRTMGDRMKQVAHEMTFGPGRKSGMDRATCDLLRERLAAAARCHREFVDAHCRAPVVRAAAEAHPELAGCLHALFAARPGAEDMSARQRAIHLDQCGLSEEAFGSAPDYRDDSAPACR